MRIDKRHRLPPIALAIWVAIAAAVCGAFDTAARAQNYTLPEPSAAFASEQPSVAVPAAPGYTVAQPTPAATAWGQPINPTNSQALAQPAAQILAPQPPVCSEPAECPCPENCCAPVVESTLYTRIEYFTLSEAIGNGRIITPESGELTTLGWQYRNDSNRVRAEIFGGQVNYSSYIFTPSDWFDFVSTNTDYIGVRGEYDWIYNPQMFPHLSFFIGGGTRYWHRNVEGGVTQNGVSFDGFQENWWSIYPYIGLEDRRVITNHWQFYGMARLGITAFTLETISGRSANYYPDADLNTQGEIGIRGPHWFVAFTFDDFGIGESGLAQHFAQPATFWSTVGLKTGYSF